MPRYAFPPMFAVVLLACGGKTGDQPSAVKDTNSVEPVAACVQYQSALDRCFHRETGFASDPTMLPKGPGDRERLERVCSENLARLTVACR